MFCLMMFANTLCKCLVCYADSGRTIGGYLVSHRQMQPHVQKRIGAAIFRFPVFIQYPIRVIEE